MCLLIDCNTEERSFELECISIESSKTEMQREQELGKQHYIQGLQDNFKGVTYAQWKKGAKRNRRKF